MTTNSADLADFATRLCDTRARARAGRLPEDAVAAETAAFSPLAADRYLAAVASPEGLERKRLWARRAVHLGRGKVW